MGPPLFRKNNAKYLPSISLDGPIHIKASAASNACMPRKMLMHYFSLQFSIDNENERAAYRQQQQQRSAESLKMSEQQRQNPRVSNPPRSANLEQLFHEALPTMDKALYHSGPSAYGSSGNLFQQVGKTF